VIIIFFKLIDIGVCVELHINKRVSIWFGKRKKKLIKEGCRLCEFDSLLLCLDKALILQFSAMLVFANR